LDLSTVARWIGYLGSMGLAGAAVFQAIVHFRLTGPHPEASTGFLGRARAAGFLAALFFALSLVLKLLGQLQLLVEPGEPVTRELFNLVMLESAWGVSWRIQAGVALAALILLPLIRNTWLLVPLAAAVLTVSPLTGHAVENPWGQSIGLFLHGLHQLGGGAWLGTLTLVVAAGYGGTRSLGEEERNRVIATLVHSYSPVALGGVGVAVLAGLAMAYGYLGSLNALWSSNYGRTLLVKTLLLVLTATLGAYNWKRLRPALGDSAASSRLYRSATLELVLGALLLGATAVLVAMPAPCC
jgi:copper transport protein